MAKKTTQKSILGPKTSAAILGFADSVRPMIQYAKREEFDRHVTAMIKCRVIEEIDLSE